MDPTFALRDFECGQNYDPEHPMSRACAEFLFTALALRQEYAELESSYVKRRAQAEEDFQAYRAEPANYDSVSARGARLPFDAPPIKQPPFLAVWRAQRVAAAVEEQFRRHMLVALMSAYDRFLGELLRAAYKLCPQLLDSSARDLRWRDIKDYHSVEEVLGLVIEREVSADPRNARRPVEMARQPPKPARCQHRRRGPRRLHRDRRASQPVRTHRRTGISPIHQRLLA